MGIGGSRFEATGFGVLVTLRLAAVRSSVGPTSEGPRAKPAPRAPAACGVRVDAGAFTPGMTSIGAAAGRSIRAPGFESAGRVVAGRFRDAAAGRPSSGLAAGALGELGAVGAAASSGASSAGGSCAHAFDVIAAVSINPGAQARVISFVSRTSLVIFHPIHLSSLIDRSHEPDRIFSPTRGLSPSAVPLQHGAANERTIEPDLQFALRAILPRPPEHSRALPCALLNPP